MAGLLATFVTLSIVLISATAAPCQGKIDVRADRITVEIDGRPFTSLHFGKENGKPYLHPLLTASGKNVTRAFPMEQLPGDPTDHPHQRGVWIGAEHLSEIDFWENEPSYDRPRKGQIVVERVQEQRSGRDEGSFTILAHWISPEKETLIAETLTMNFYAGRPGTRQFDVDLRLKAQKQVTFADNHDAILGLRLAPAFDESRGSRVVNAEGLQGSERVRGQRSAWVDWQADLQGEKVGIVVMDSPKNFRFPTRWHVRDYSLLFASPFAQRDYNPSEPDWSKTLQKGEELRLRYRILIHPPNIDVAAAFKEFSTR